MFVRIDARQLSHASHGVQSRRISTHSHWSLGAKRLIVGTPFLLLGLALIAVSLWVFWQLDGGAAAVNEAGRMRMQTYRMSLAYEANIKGVDLDAFEQPLDNG